MNIAAGWINGYNPPHGLILNSDEYAIPSSNVISVVQALLLQTPSMVNIPLTTSPRYVGMLQLPPTPNYTPIVPLVVNSHNSGMTFRQLCSRINPNVSADDTITLGNDSANILMVNSCPING